MSITIEAETPGDSRTLFRVIFNGTVVATGLTAAQAHLIVGDALAKIALPRAA
ncbi:MAG TPA: hypothetical protein VKS78_15980 [Roseiarcus sp.]|nr:hypothetical protein [Roseiarcus sp.]